MGQCKTWGSPIGLSSYPNGVPIGVAGSVVRKRSMLVLRHPELILRHSELILKRSELILGRFDVILKHS